MTKDRSERVAQLAGVGGFNDNTAPHVNTYYQAAGGGGAPDGSDSMSRIVVLSPVRLLQSFIQRIFIESIDVASDDGWSIQWDGTKYIFEISDSSLDVYSVNLTPGKKPKAGEVYVLQCSYDGDDLLIRCKGETATTNAGSGLGFTVASDKLTIGARDDVTEQPAKDFIIHAALATDSDAMTLAQMVTAEAAIIELMEQGGSLVDASGNVISLPVDMEHAWLAEDVVIGPGALETIWTDRIGAVDIIKVGEPQGFGIQARF